MAYIGDGNKKLHAMMTGSKKQSSFRNSPTYRLLLMFIVVLGVIGMAGQYSFEIALYYGCSVFTSGLIGWLIGRSKARGMDGFCLGLVFGPLGLVISLLLKDDTRRPCPHCKESIKKAAAICPHCHQDLLIKPKPIQQPGTL